MKRREFLQISGIAGAGLLLGFLPEANANKVVNAGNLMGTDANLTDFVFIDTEGNVTILAISPEMGQGVHQSLPMLIAEELEVDIDKIRIVQAMASKEKYGNQSVGGSRSIRNHFTPLRKVGASARMMLLQAAAETWACDIANCEAKNGEVVNKTTNAKLHYGELVEKASKLTVPNEVELKKSSDFTIVGKPIRRQDIHEKINGSAVFGIDVELENMLYASVERNPYHYGKVVGYNKEEVEAIEGIHSTHIISAKVFSNERYGVAILSNDYYTALKARDILKVEWEASREKLSTADVFAKFHEAVNETPQLDKTDNEDKVLAEKETTKITAIYECPYQVHATMEPPVATVWVKDDKTAEAWLSAQNPHSAQSKIAEILDTDLANVKVNITYIGSGLGRKTLTDFTEEATRLSQLTKRPVKVIWTREDDITAGIFRPATVNVFSAGFDSNNKVVSYNNRFITQIFANQFSNDGNYKFPKWTFEGTNQNYKFPNFNLKGHHVELSIPVMWWRSVYASTNGFVNEAFVDEMAEKAGIDPIEFRIQYTKEERFHKLLNAIRKQSNWDKTEENEYKGFAVVESFGSICAQVITVEKKDDGIKIIKIDAIVDCGQTVNPDTVKAQIEGGIIMGLSAAIKPPIEFKEGKTMQSNFDTYDILRYGETPEIVVGIMDNNEAPGGVGEPGLPPVAAALANALFKATGKRFRKLPIDIKL